MDKPTVFISSTIYDFADLRSSMKYWLDEMGFETQLSEYNDFKKDLTQNSYDACLDAVGQCSYFILLIGSRKGGMYPGEDISITRKEYRTAYQLAKEGKIKKIIIFIRQSVWDVKEDRKSLHKLLEELKIIENDKEIDKSYVEYYNSNILKDAEHIISFINEVTRNQEAKNEQKPIMNWVHTFRTFEDVIKVLKSELGIQASMSVRIAEQSVKNVLIYNMQNIAAYEEGNVVGYYLGFRKIRNKLKEYREAHYPLNPNGTISLTTEEIREMSDFVLFFRNGIKDVDTSIFENIISSGVFLSYSYEQDMFVQSKFCKALFQMVREIKRLKRFEIEFSYEMQDGIVEKIKENNKYSTGMCDFVFFDLAMLNGIYERLVNIQKLTEYLIQYINRHDDTLAYPELLEGLVDSSRPPEEAISKIFG